MKFKLIIVLEILALVIVPLSFSIRKYNNWPEEKVSAGTSFHDSGYRGSRNNQGKMMTVMMYSCDSDDSWLFEFSDYTPEIKAEDTLTIKTDPEDRSHAVYLPYEKYKLIKRRIIAIVICLVAVIITVIWYRVEKEVEKELHPYSFTNKTGNK